MTGLNDPGRSFNHQTTDSNRLPFSNESDIDDNDDEDDDDSEEAVSSGEESIVEERQYQPLPQFEEVDVPQERRVVEARQRYQSNQVEDSLQVWNDTSDGDDGAVANCPVNDIVLDSNKKETIMNAMAEIKLPDSSIPLWAKEMTSEQWNDMLRSKLNLKT